MKNLSFVKKCIITFILSFLFGFYFSVSAEKTHYEFNNIEAIIKSGDKLTVISKTGDYELQHTFEINDGLKIISDVEEQGKMIVELDYRDKSIFFSEKNKNLTIHVYEWTETMNYNDETDFSIIN